MSGFNDRVIAEFRANGGRVEAAAGFGDSLVLLHTTGARSGERRVNPAMALRDGGGWLIVASAKGAPADPAWAHNLRAHADISIEARVADRDRTVEVTAAELTGAERDEAFARWYTAWGERFHVGGENRDHRATALAALADAGLPESLIEAYAPVAGDETDTALRASHENAISRVGDDVGTPVISFGEGTAYFGPVVSPAPKGEDAGRLLDALATMATLDGFYELKRDRTGGVDFS